MSSVIHLRLLERDLLPLDILKDKHVRIYSSQHGMWWRPDARGYTDKLDDAGIFTGAEALLCSGHCGPEKGIQYQIVDSEYSI